MPWFHQARFWNASIVAGVVITAQLSAQDPRHTAHEGSWSSDGRRVLFVATGGTGADLFLANADGSNVAQLTRDSFPDYYPEMSPDGRRIAYLSVRDSAMRLVVMNADGSGPVDLGVVTARGGHLNPVAPSWSPDGRRIAYGTSRLGTSEIFTVNPDGSDDRRLASGTQPAWSHDGSRIAYTARVDSVRQLFVIRADGTGARQITTTAGTKVDPSWSADNSFIMYVIVLRDPSGAMDGRWPKNLNDIYMINPDGSNDRALAITAEREFEPRLSPDGKRLLYLRDHTREDGRRANTLFIKTIDGSADHPLFPAL